MKRVYRTLSQDIWQVGNKFVNVETNKRPSTKYPESGFDSLESAVEICRLIDQIDLNDPMSIFDKFELTV